MPSLQVPFTIYPNTTHPLKVEGLAEQLRTISPSLELGVYNGMVPDITVAVVGWKVEKTLDAGQTVSSLGGMGLLRISCGTGSTRLLPLNEDTSDNTFQPLQLSSNGDVANFLNGGFVEMTLDPWTLGPWTSATNVVEFDSQLDLQAWGANLPIVNSSRETLFLNTSSSPNEIGAIIGTSVFNMLVAGGIEDANDPVSDQATGGTGLILSSVVKRPLIGSTSLGGIYSQQLDLGFNNGQSYSLGLRFNPANTTYVSIPRIGTIAIFPISEAKDLSDGSARPVGSELTDYTASSLKYPILAAPQRAVNRMRGVLNVDIG